MARKEQTNVEAGQEQKRPDSSISKKVSDHLANQRTFLAWIRTGLATITFGFVVERFGLLLRELGLRNSASTNINTIHYSAIIGISLTLLGVVVMIVALLHFLQIRRAIDRELFHPPVGFAVVLTVLASLIGLLLAIYLALTA